MVASLLIMQTSMAAPVKNANLQLAMLALSKQSQRVLPKKSISAVKSKIIFQNNCMLWNANQIRIKAKPFNEIINKYARLNQVDSNLIKAVITAESCFRTKALSHAKAQGLMQLIPATAERFGVTDSYNPSQNIRGGTKYLKFLLDRYKGNLKKTIAAYNAGEGKVDRYKGIPPYKETQQYVKNVLKVYELLRPKARIKKRKSRVKAVYHPPKIGLKPGRHGWQYNRRLAPHLYKR